MIFIDLVVEIVGGLFNGLAIWSGRSDSKSDLISVWRYGADAAIASLISYRLL